MATSYLVKNTFDTTSTFGLDQDICKCSIAKPWSRAGAVGLLCLAVPLTLGADRSDRDIIHFSIHHIQICQSLLIKSKAIFKETLCLCGGDSVWPNLHQSSLQNPVWERHETSVPLSDIGQSVIGEFSFLRHFFSYFLLMTDDVRWSITSPKVNLESPEEYELIVGPDVSCVRGPQSPCIRWHFHSLSVFARHIHIQYSAIGTLYSSKWSHLFRLSGTHREEDEWRDRHYLSLEKWP